MNYSKILKYDIANAPYVCSTLFVSGCTHNCKGCFNKVAQDFNYGNKWTKDIEDMFINYCQDKYVKSINILGGEPFQNIDDLIILLNKIKSICNKPIWIWSGFTYEQLIRDKQKIELLKLCDILVDGKFVESKKDLSLKYRGSSNQRVIDIQKSLKQGKVILSKYN